jgi:tRNA(fMet)-specific endonuclease VapC
MFDFLRGRGPGAGAVRQWIVQGRLRLTVVTAFDLRVGAHFLARGGGIENLLGRRTLPLDVLGALHAGEAFARLRESGSEIGIKDCLQAGICRRFSLPLATRNLRHFGRIPGLRLQSAEDST